MQSGYPSLQHDVDRAIDFHGAFCVCLAFGVQAARYARARFGPVDTGELVAVADTDRCAVDALQAILRCTTGNRTLVVRDWGKNAFIFFRRHDHEGVRLVVDPFHDPAFSALQAMARSGRAGECDLELFEEMAASAGQRALEMDPHEIFRISSVSVASLALPPSAIDSWSTCSRCQEPVLTDRTRDRGEERLCLACVA